MMVIPTVRISVRVLLNLVMISYKFHSHDMENVCSKWCKTHVVTISRRRRGVILFLLLLWSLQQLTE